MRQKMLNLCQKISKVFHAVCLLNALAGWALFFSALNFAKADRDEWGAFFTKKNPKACSKLLSNQVKNDAQNEKLPKAPGAKAKDPATAPAAHPNVAATYSNIKKHMIDIQVELTKNTLLHGGKQSKASAKDIGLRLAFDALDKKLKNNFSAMKYKAAHAAVSAATTKILLKRDTDKKETKNNIQLLKSQKNALLKKIKDYEVQISELKNNIATTFFKIRDADINFSIDINPDMPIGEHDYLLVKDLKKNSLALLDKDTTSLYRSDYENYFIGMKFGYMLKRKISGAHYAFINHDGDFVFFKGQHEYIINSKNKKETYAKRKIAHKGRPLVAYDEAQKRLIIVDFSRSKLIIRDNTGHENSITLNGFKEYCFDNIRKCSSYELSKILVKEPKGLRTFVTNDKLIAVYYPEEGRVIPAAFIIDIHSGATQHIKTFRDDIAKIVSVDNNGNIYGTEIKDQQKTLNVFKFSPFSPIPHKAVSKITLRNATHALDSQNSFLSATVDSSGLYIITAEYHQKTGGSGFYLYSIKTGQPVFHANIVAGSRIQVGFPREVISKGENQLVFVTMSDKIDGSRGMYGVSMDLPAAIGPTEETISKIENQIQNTKQNLDQINSELKVLEIPQPLRPL